MKTAERITSNRWTTMPGNRAHGVEDQHSSCSNTRAAKQEKVRPMGECFFLTSPFIELIGCDRTLNYGTGLGVLNSARTTLLKAQNSLAGRIRSWFFQAIETPGRGF